MPTIYDVYEFYLEPRDLQEKAHVVTVESTRLQDVFNNRNKKNEKKVVIRFVKRRKAMILNKTQAGDMERIAGTDDYSKWVGTEIVLITDRAPNGKDTIRVCKRGESGDADIDHPKDVDRPKRETGEAGKETTLPEKPGWKKKGKPVMSRYDGLKLMLQGDAESAFNSACLMLSLNGDRKAVLDQCEGDYRTATEFLMEKYKDKLS
jgi:hypothetical protein